MKILESARSTLKRLALMVSETDTLRMARDMTTRGARSTEPDVANATSAENRPIEKSAGRSDPQLEIEMELEIVNKLYLELSQITTAKTARECELEDLLTSARSIAQRMGVGTAWERFDARIARAGIGAVTAKTFRALPSDA